MRFVTLILAVGSLTTAMPAGELADRLLAAVDQAAWLSPLPANAHCTARVPAQMDIQATQQWTHTCAATRDGIVVESFFYVFAGDQKPVRLRVDVHAVGAPAELPSELSSRLARRFSRPDHAPQMMEIGFRRLRSGQPVAGEHWKHGDRHYFLHANPSRSSPLGVRTGAQLVVMHERLFAERMRDELILELEGFGDSAHHDLIEEQLRRNVGEHRRLGDLLENLDAAARPQQAYRLLAADREAAKAAARLADNGEARAVRALLARHNAKLGGTTHSGGLAYRNDLLWRVWHEYPDTEAGELAFLQLERRGWYTVAEESCPANPDLFREVIAKGEAFLRDHPRSIIRTELIYLLAVANESWWSVAHAPAGDPMVESVPYPRRTANREGAQSAREQAIRYYREVARVAPGSAYAAAADRRLPRLQLGLDTGQRRFFCFYC